MRLNKFIFIWKWYF